jgi:hypothetical protein
LHIDDFGNIITNINEKEVARSRLKEAVNVELPTCKLKLYLFKAYGETKPHQPLALIGSHGFLEIALNQGNAAKKFKAKPGEEITISSA